VTETYEVSLKLNSGKMTPSAAFLSGKVKPRGNVPKMMSMTPLLQSPDFKAWDEARAAMTDA
jgi:putative sterol carrier protein